MLRMLTIKNRSNDIECLKVKTILKVIQLIKTLVFLYRPIKKLQNLTI